jgi:hypothetical protein
VEPDPERVPDLLRKPADVPPPPPAGASAGASAEPSGEPSGEPEVGEFRQGSPWSQWALSRYLVGRAITESAGIALLVVGLAIVVLAVLAQWPLHVTGLAVLLAIIAGFVLLLRWLLLTAVRRLTALPQDPSVERRMNALVADTRGDVLRELRRLGLPGRVWTLWLLPMFFLGRSRRARTADRLRGFDVARVVPKARLDETFLLLRRAFADGSAGGAR